MLSLFANKKRLSVESLFLIIKINLIYCRFALFKPNGISQPFAVGFE